MTDQSKEKNTKPIKEKEENKEEKKEEKKQDPKNIKEEKKEEVDKTKKEEKEKEDKKDPENTEKEKSEKGSKDGQEKKEEKKEEKKQEIPEFSPGDLIQVHQKVKKGNDKTYTQVFEGIVLAKKHGNGPGATFTLRGKAAGGVGVEKVFPLYLPSIEKIKVVKRHKVRRSKLYYLRNYRKKLKEKK